MTLSPPVAHAVQTVQEWLKELKAKGELADEEAAYRVLGAVLHRLRDRLTVNEAANLGAQLPLVVRGLYYEGWRPSSVPSKVRSKDKFLDELSAAILPITYPVEWAVTAVFSLLARHCDPGEIADVIDQLPGDLKGLWPDTARSVRPQPVQAASGAPKRVKKSSGTSKASASRHTPHDDPEPGTPGTGEDVCPECHGKGKVADKMTGKATGELCGRCDGTGIIVEGIG